MNNAVENEMLNGLVSVIMPVYNGAEFLSQAVRSVLEQDYPHWELIVIDDGSTDQSAAIIRSFGQQEPRIRYVFQQNAGQAAALNHGLRIMRGEYVTTLDADDWYTPQSLQARVKFLQDHQDFDVVYGNGVYCDIEGKPIKKFSENRINHVAGDVYGVLIRASFFGTGGNVMVRSNAIHQHNLRYDETITWCQDYDFYIRLSADARFGLIDEDLIYYRLHDGNMTASMPTSRRVDHLIRLKMKVLSTSRFSDLPEDQKVQFFYDMLNNVLANRLEDQQDLLQHQAFLQLSGQNQAKLLRWSANHHLVKGKHPAIAKAWVQRAFSLSPLDIKTFGVYLVTQLNVQWYSAVVQRLKNRS